VTRVLLLGAGGMLGHAIARSAPATVTLLGPALPRIEITDRQALRAAVAQHRPRWIINAAAYTRVDDAERDAAQAMRVNAEAVGMLGETARETGAAVLHVGTDFIFPGDATRPYRETDAPAPRNRYGESKLAGERALLDSGARALVVRAQWLFGVPGRSLPRTMWERARAGMPSRVVADQHGRPTLTDDLAHAMWDLVARDATGVVHVANEGAATWYDLAREVYAAAGHPELVTPCTSAEYATPARRPARAVLDTSRHHELTGAVLPHWRDALARWLDQMRPSENATAPK
jgi:dTDP-4-dehydrorhamnose reductase